VIGDYESRPGGPVSSALGALGHLSPVTDHGLSMSAAALDAAELMASGNPTHTVAMAAGGWAAKKLADAMVARSKAAGGPKMLQQLARTRSGLLGHGLTNVGIVGA
jgi:hypothetical protein